MTNGTSKSNLLKPAKFFDTRSRGGVLVHAIVSAAIIGQSLKMFLDSQKNDAPYVGLAIVFALYFSYLLSVKRFYDWILPSRRDAT